MKSLNGVSVLGRNLEMTRVSIALFSIFSVQILGLVAKGSFGIVFKVLDCGRKSVFAVKVGT